MNPIQKSIGQYYDAIMKDMNASVRIVIEGKEDKTYISRVIDWKDLEISFHAPLVQGDYVQFIRDQTYPFIFVTKQCVYMTTIYITSFAKNSKGHFYYKGTITSPLKKNQQRRYFRLEWVEPFTYRVGESPDPKKGAILDISAGGLRIAAKDKIGVNDQIHISITLMDTPIELYGIVLEKLEKNSADLYVYRVQFHEPSKNTENLIASLIMRRQRDMLKMN